MKYHILNHAHHARRALRHVHARPREHERLQLVLGVRHGALNVGQTHVVHVVRCLRARVCGSVFTRYVMLLWLARAVQDATASSHRNTCTPALPRAHLRDLHQPRLGHVNVQRQHALGGQAREERGGRGRRGGHGTAARACAWGRSRGAREGVAGPRQRSRGAHRQRGSKQQQQQEQQASSSNRGSGLPAAAGSACGLGARSPAGCMPGSA